MRLSVLHTTAHALGHAHNGLSVTSSHLDRTAGFLDATFGEAYFRAATAVLAASPSAHDDDNSAQLLSRFYDLSGSIEVLSSEVERTAQVNRPDGEPLILKTSCRTDAIDSFRFQSAALAALEDAQGFVVPRVLPTTDDRLMFESDSVWGYLQTRVAGQPLHEITTSPKLLYATGRALANLTLALAQIDVPAIHRPVLWHIGCWPHLLEFAPHLPSGPVADLAHLAVRTYIETIKPQLSAVPWQVTHNDPSPYNTLLTQTGIAFIDFGDGCWGPRILDLAIAASHRISDPSMALGGAEYLIAGYTSVVPLSDIEMRLLVGLIRARQSALILVNHWRADLFPADAPYIKKNVWRAEKGLSILAGLGDAEAEAAVRSAVAMVCDEPTSSGMKR